MADLHYLTERRFTAKGICDMERKSKTIANACSFACIVLFLAQPALSQRTVFDGVQIRLAARVARIAS